MKLSQKTQTLFDLIQPAVAVCGVELWGLEFLPQGKRSLLRIYIDRPDAEIPALPAGFSVPALNPDQDVADDVVDSNAPDEQLDEDAPETGRGIGVQDCVNVTHQVNGVLDVHDPISGEYILEVSSPGWDRPFFTLAQMQPYVGQTVHLRLIAPVANRRKITGLLKALENEVLTVEFDGVTVTVDADNIDKANLVFAPV
ncbi:ribosome assembly cofactor RimP [Aquirhabdus sp.]|uniref:ribosome assembly cofactor RimP n=1 Tax=Aquirhabdus sp. TaxID=2824160 RepID=UPI00396C62A5